MGLWAWAKERVSSVSSWISQSYSTLSSGVRTFTALPAVRNFVYSFSIKGWEGATRFFDPHNVTKLFPAKKTRGSLSESFKANVVYYLSFALLYEVTYQTIVSNFSDEDDSYLESSLYLTMSMFAMIGLGGLMAHRYYENTVINLALAKQVSDENPTSHHYKPCGCDEGAIISAGVFSSINLSGKLLSIWIASFLPVIKYFTPFAYAYAYGESLAEYPYSAVGVCTKHRAEELAKHNAYSWGIGASLYAVGELITYLIYRQTGVNSFFISNAVYAAIYPWFVTSVLLRDRPLPGDKQGVDVFYYHRYVLQHMADNIGKQILPLLQSADKSIDWKKRLQSMVEFAPVRWTRKALSYDVYGNWHSLDEFIASPANTVFFEEYYEMTKQQLDKVIDLRDKPLLKRPIKEIPIALLAPIVPVLPDKVTQFVMTDAYKQLIKIILDKSLEDPLKNTREGLEYIRKVQETAKIKVVKHDARRLKELLHEAMNTSIAEATETTSDGQDRNLNKTIESCDEKNKDVKSKDSQSKKDQARSSGSKEELKPMPSLAKQSLFSASLQKQEKIAMDSSPELDPLSVESSDARGKDEKEEVLTQKKKSITDFIIDDYYGQQGRRETKNLSTTKKSGRLEVDAKTTSSVSVNVL